MDEAAPQAAAGTSEGIASAEGLEWRRPHQDEGNEACGVVGMGQTDGTDQAQGEQGEPQDAETSAAEDPALSALIYGWGDAYEIWRDEEGCHGRRRDGLGGVLTEDNPDALYNAIWDDYTTKRVPRDLPAEADR